MIRTILLAAALALAPADAALAQPKPTAPPAKPPAVPAAQPRELADTRETEAGYGISLRPPLGTRVVKRTADHYAMRLADDDGFFTMALAVKNLNQEVDFRKVIETAVKVGGPLGDFEIIDRRDVAIADRPGHIIYARVVDIRGKESMHAQAFFQVDPRTYALFEANCLLDAAPIVQPTFERVVESIQITDPKELNKQRQAQVEAGERWKSALTIAQRRAALVPEQFYRFVQQTEGGGQPRDYGYMRVRQKSIDHKGVPAIHIEVQARIQTASSNFDTAGEYVLADDDSYEGWNVRTTERPIRPTRGRADTATHPTYEQRGVRANREIVIHHHDPLKPNRSQSFAQPPLGYLAQVEALILPQTLPIDQRATYGFYFFNTQTGAVTYRTEQLVPTLTGYTLLTRMGPNAPELKANYDKKRNLIEKQLDTQGNMLIPTTPQMIQQLWRNR